MNSIDSKIPQMPEVRIARLEEELLTAEAEVERLRAALQPFAAFADAWDRRPIRGLDDELYGIHGGEDRGVLRLSDCQIARAALAPEVKS